MRGDVGLVILAAIGLVFAESLWGKVVSGLCFVGFVIQCVCKYIQTGHPFSLALPLFMGVFCWVLYDIKHMFDPRKRDKD